MAQPSLAAQHQHHRSGDPHTSHGRVLPDLVLGAQDGLVNTLGVVLGVAAASGEARIVLATGLAAGVAEAISMAAVAYTTSRARGELFESERQREYRHVEAVPDLEREEVRKLFEERGLSGERLERLVSAICSEKDVWVAVMMAEEHRLSPEDRGASLRSAVVVGIASLLGALLPVAPFALASIRAGVVLALALGAASLFALGAYKARITTGRIARSGFELAVIGIVSALAGYVIGLLFSAS